MPRRRKRQQTKRQSAHQKSGSSAIKREKVLRASDEWASFRLLDLPAELRNRVYRDYIQDFTANTVGVTLLTYTVLPNLCDVSRQLRKEVRPLWFSETLFTICVGAKFFAQRQIGRNLTLLGRHVNSRNIGVLLISMRASEILRNAGNDALIRRVRFVLFENAEMYRVWASEERLPHSRRPQEWPSHINRIGALKLESPVAVKLKLTEEINNFDPWWRPGWGLTRFSIIDPAGQRAIAVSQRGNFRGFSLLDLRHAAAAFKVHWSE